VSNDFGCGIEVKLDQKGVVSGLVVDLKGELDGEGLAKSLKAVVARLQPATCHW
jgi:hypothetical protein